MINHIVACDANYGIGKNNDLPWPKNKEDFRLFKTLTIGNTVIMGRKTYDSLPERKPYKNLGDNEYYQTYTTKALPDRINLVISKTLSDGEYMYNKHNGVYVSKNMDSITYGENNDGGLLSKHRFIIGGATLYEQTIDQTEMIYMTKFKESYDCDTFYPYEKLQLEEKLKGFWLMSTIKYDSFDLLVYKKK